MNRVRIDPQLIDHSFMIPFNGHSTLYVSVGDQVDYGQCIFDAVRRKMAESHYLPKLLSIKPEDSENYVGRIAGEYIEKGDLLAEKLTAGGLIERKVVSSGSGIISLDRISQGYIDILGESIKISYESTVKGKIVGISLGSHIEIECSSAILPYASGNNLKSDSSEDTNSIIGQLVLVKDGRSVFGPEDLKRSYDGQIVYAGRFLYPSLAKEIFLRGALAIISYSINYADLQELNMPICILGGFGQLRVDMNTEYFITKSVNHLIEINDKDKKIYVANQEGVDMNRYPGKKYFSNKLVSGDTVISIGPDNKGITGEVVEIIEQEGADKVILSTKGKNRIVIYDEMLEQYYFKTT